jgi:hypothetical protein
VRELGIFGQGDLVKERVSPVDEASDSTLPKKAKEFVVLVDVERFASFVRARGGTG